MNPHEDTIEPLEEMTEAVIDPELMQSFGSLSESGIRRVASKFGIVLESRVGDKDKLLAELTRKFRGKKHGRRTPDC